MKRTDAIRYCLLVLLLTLAVGTRADSIPERMEEDSVSYEMPKPRDFNAIRFSMDRLHRYRGDAMSKGNNFIDFGAGYMALYHANQNATEPLTTLHLRFGKQFSPLHTARIGLSGGVGYMRAGLEGEGAQTLNGAFGVEADYLFSMSSYLLGYRPERALDVSPFIGIGYNYAFLGAGNNRKTAYYLKEKASSMNAHAGVQFKFFAGPHASLTAEPFVQINSADIDLANQSKNWHKYNVSYGLNLSYIYYFNNQLTPPSMTGDFKRHFGEGQRWLQGSDEDKAQRRPFFFHYATGVAAYNTFEDLRYGKTIGPSHSFGFGGWLSSAIGLRATLNMANGAWSETGDKTNMMGYAGVAIDALLNPFGFTRYYDWESKAGLTLLAGYETGLMKMISTQHYRSTSIVMGYHLAMQPWVRLSHDTRLFFEPMYTILIHRQGDDNRKRDDQLTFQLGVELLMGNRQDIRPESAVGVLPSGYYIGIGGGWNNSVRKWRYTDHSAGMFKNAMLMAGYHFNEYSGVMLNEEYQTESIRLENGDEQKWKNWMTSVDYQLNLSNFLTGYQPNRRWTVSTMLGPTVAFNSDKTHFGVNLGLQLEYRFLRHLALFYQHRIYWMDNSLYTTDQFYNQLGTVISSMNFGLMYVFDDLVGPTTRIAKGAAKGIASAAHATGKGISNLFIQERSPFFMDYGYGLAWFPGMPADTGDTFGHSLQMSMGWWMLPSIGARFGINASKGGAVNVKASEYGNVSDVITSVVNGSLFADLLINPLGFRSHYNWNQQFGVNLMAGFQRGVLVLAGNKSQVRNNTNGLRAGLQLWVKLQDNLRFQIEPMYTHLFLNNVFVDDDTNSLVTTVEQPGFHKLDAKTAMSIRFGLTTLLQNPKKRKSSENSIFNEPRFFVAGGGGWNFNLNKWRYTDSGMNLNALAVAGYRLNEHHLVRAQFEYASLGDDVVGEESHNIGLHFTSLDYQLDLTTLFNGYDNQRRWNVGVFGGPSMDKSWSLGLNLGVTAEYKLDSHWGLFYNHNAYLFSLFDNHKVYNNQQLVASGIATLNTFNLGVSYHF